MKRILLSWSSGKDSAWSLHVLRLRAEYEVVGLLTTFNEADMSAVMALRTRHKEAFQKKQGVGLGFMSFFVKAVVGETFEVSATVMSLPRRCICG